MEKKNKNQFIAAVIYNPKRFRSFNIQSKNRMRKFRKSKKKINKIVLFNLKYRKIIRK